MKLKTTLLSLFLATTVFSAHAATDTPKSGYFIATNSTSHSIKIKVGNFWPSSYKLAPHSSKTIFVSTNNQDIEISDIS